MEIKWKLSSILKRNISIYFNLNFLFGKIPQFQVLLIENGI